MNGLLIFILAALSMLGALSIDAYLPALPTIAGQFSVDMAAAQQSLTVYVLGFAIMTLFYGMLSDSFGRKPVILVSLVAYLLGTLGAATANSLESLIVYRAIQGLSAGGGAVVGRAIVGDLFSGADAHRAMSYISVVFGLAPAIAPVMGGWLLSIWGWRSIFIVIAIFTVLLLLACSTVLHESLPVAKRQPFKLLPILAAYGKVSRHLPFTLMAVSMAMAFSGIMIHVAAAPTFVIEIFKLKVTDFGWLFIPLIGGMTLGSFAVAKCSHRMKAETIIRISFAIMLVSALAYMAAALFAPGRVWFALPAIFCYAFGASASAPGMTMIALEMFPEVRGLCASLQSFYFMGLFSIESGVVAPLLSGGQTSFAIVVLAGALLSLGCWMASSFQGKKPLAA